MKPPKHQRSTRKASPMDNILALDSRIKSPLYRVEGTPCGVCSKPLPREAQYTVRGLSKVYCGKHAAQLIEAADKLDREESQEQRETRNPAHY